MANPPILSTSQEGIVHVEPLEPTRGHEEGCSQARTYDKSKAIYVDALEPWVTTLETLMSATQATFKSLEERVNGLESEYVDFTVAA